MISIRKVLLALGVLAAAFSTGGCGKNDCAYVCYRWEDCFTLQGGADACTEECEVKAKNNTSYRGDVQACSECVETKACTEALSCGLDCVSAIAR